MIPAFHQRKANSDLRHRFRIPSVALMLFFAPLYPVLADVLVTFDSASDLSNNFQFNGPNRNFAFQATGGVTGGALDAGATSFSDGAVLKTGSFNIAVGTTLTTSIYWFYDARLRDPENQADHLKLGFATRMDEMFYPPIGIRLQSQPRDARGSGLTLYVNGNSTVSSLNQTHLTSGHWYKSAVRLTHVGGELSRFELSTTTDDYGTEGLSPPVSVAPFTASGFFNSANLAAAPQLLGTFFASSKGGTDRLDNYTVATAVPEPGAPLLLALSLAALPMLGRPRSSSCQ